MLCVLTLGLGIAFAIAHNITKQIKAFSRSIILVFRTRGAIFLDYKNEQELFDVVLSGLDNSYVEITSANKKPESLMFIGKFHPLAASLKSRR